MKLTRTSMYVLVPVMLVGACRLIQVYAAEEAASQEAAVEEGRERSRNWLKNVAGTGVDVKIFGALELACDSNVYQYSDADRRAFKRNDATRQTQFRHVDGLDDFVTIPSLGIGLKKAFVEDRPTELTVNTTMHLYGSNTVKNYEEYEVDLKQRLTKDAIVRIGYSLIPEFVLRNLFDTDQPSGREYQLATYSKHSLRTSLWYRWTPIVRSRFLYQVDVVDYNDFFNERDHTTHTGDLTGFFHLTDWLVWRLSYEISQSDAEASDGDADVDPDTSYLQNEVGTSLDLLLTSRLTMRSSYTWARRRFTTDNSSADDRLHRGRRDTRQSLGVKVIYEMWEDGEVYVRWERRANDASISFAAGVRGDTDVLGYDENVVALGVRFRI